MLQLVPSPLISPRFYCFLLLSPGLLLCATVQMHSLLFVTSDNRCSFSVPYYSRPEFFFRSVLQSSSVLLFLPQSSTFYLVSWHICLSVSYSWSPGFFFQLQSSYAVLIPTPVPLCSSYVSTAGFFFSFQPQPPQVLLFPSPVPLCSSSVFTLLVRVHLWLPAPVAQVFTWFSTLDSSAIYFCRPRLFFCCLPLYHTPVSLLSYLPAPVLLLHLQPSCYSCSSLLLPLLH